MNNQVFQQVLNILAERRRENEHLEERRRKEAIKKCPEIGEIIEARHNAIMKSVYNAFSIPVEERLTEKVEEWNKRIKALLQDNGFSEDYLDPIFTCPLCEDTGFTGQTKKKLCACAQALYAQLMEKQNDFSESQTFETYDESMIPDLPLPNAPDISQRHYTAMLRDKCRTYADALPNPPQKTLLMLGRSGLGKTFLLRSIQAKARERDIPALCITANQLIRTARKAIFNREQEEMDALYETTLLLIDDLGTEPMIENVTIEELFNLINERQNAGLCTVLSTNLTLNEIKSRYTERILSRLNDSRQCLKLQFFGQDIRRL